MNAGCSQTHNIAYLLGAITGKTEIASIHNKQACEALFCLTTFSSHFEFHISSFLTGQFPLSGNIWYLVKADENPVSRDLEDPRARCDSCRDDGGKEKEIEGVGGGE